MKVSWFKHVWHFVLAGVAIFIFVLAMKALYRLTKTVHVEDVISAIASIPPLHVFLALVVVAFGYLTLTLYDVIAVRQLGRKLPYPSVALTSFTAYAISHTVGANLVTATGVRYRHYSQANLTHNEIANIVLMVSMAFTFGISTLIGISLTSHPEITLQLLSQLDKSLGFFDNIAYIRGLGITLLALIMATILYAGRQGRHLLIKGWRFDLPPAKILLQQIAISILDLSTVALVLYLLLPTSEHISYWATFSAFIQSMTVGILSHVPGGLGVFEVTMISALPQVDRTQMLAVLLVFRLMYYILPFLVALLLLMAYEAYLFFNRKNSNVT
ncbi:MULTISPECIES: lysylphosphatidylglycerol synthase domain-containing protein [unclassified Moraxella]|uniref:lysylphosphatidylglycerol synthase domain-containing protein n=1 Tax=unclassified Moraxella TaxID=2685852 RepID=UPI003AF8E93D